MTSVVIPNWNGTEFLAECLNSLLPQDETTSIIVVDNGSTDGSQEMVRWKYPQIQLLELDHNHGFTGGVNRGIKEAVEQGAEFVALFNNDAVADPNWFKSLVAAASKHPDAGIITGKLLKWDRQTIDSTGECLSMWGMPFPRGRGEVDAEQYDTGEYVFGATGGASLYRAEMLKQIGLFDEKFFAYFEDVDLSFRAQLAGWKVWYEPSAVAYHHIGGTSSKISGFAFYHSLKNLAYLYSKNMPIRMYLKYFPRFIMQWLLIAASGLRRWQFGPFIKSLGIMLKSLPAVHHDRWRIQAQRKVSNEYVESLLYRHIPPGQIKLIALANKLGWKQ